ncbi:hypothetical protein HK098_003655 [Nowakowskiella sp. JEL0407]|nr:hypothetical protein HK098_003655 [Nowakowskiella sp. JEL0407]
MTSNHQENTFLNHPNEFSPSVPPKDNTTYNYQHTHDTASTLQQHQHPFYTYPYPINLHPQNQSFWRKHRILIWILASLVAVVIVAAVTAVSVLAITKKDQGSSTSAYVPSDSSPSPLYSARPSSSPTTSPRASPLGPPSTNNVELWISSVLNYSSQWSSASWSASQVIGAPNVYPTYADNSKAWTTTSYTNQEFLTLKIDRPILITQTHLYETYRPGALTKVEALVNSTVFSTLWEGSASATLPETVRIFIPELTKNATSDIIRLTFDFSVRRTWYELDAVKVVGFE